MPLEASIVASIRKRIKKDGWFSHKEHGGPYSRKGTPDLLCIKEGHAVWLEVKQPGKRPTAIQLSEMARIEREAKSPCFVVHSADEAALILKSVWMNLTKST